MEVRATTTVDFELSAQDASAGSLSGFVRQGGDGGHGGARILLRDGDGVELLSSEANASAMIIGALPFVMGSMIYLVNPGYISKLFIDPRGHTMLAIGFGMYALGIGTMIRMVKFEI